MATVKIGGRPATEVSGGPKIEDLLSVNGSLNVNMTSLLAGENQTLNGIAVYPAGSEYIAGAAVTDGAAITLGTVGAAGDLLIEVLVRNAGTGGATGNLTVSIQDGSTTIDALTTVIAEGSNATLRVNSISINGAWKLTLDSAVAGGITAAKYVATGVFT